ncbi:exodeoxyribonuclease VII large subunit [Dokdonella sp.]|uniref:exodeoxyribonuclease VII large subunit n=1 Tax=Dokdonella sp. TaxID=2291710 RepID=UPI0039C867E7
MSVTRQHDTDEGEILSPTQLNRRARELIETRFASLWIEGELSNVSRPASGHLYFTLKDAGAQVRCAMFKPRSNWLRFRPGDGMHVLLRGRVSLYEPRGEFQLIAEHMEEAGEGALRRAYEALKARLAAEGLFDQAIKRALPRWPRRIAVVTSPSGAAVRDVLAVIARRFPLVPVEILPVPVQGGDAAPAIVAMLQGAARAGRHDVLVLTRGGGSIEDLWAFNDEALARAVRAHPVPVVAAIGHETDFTIAEFAADLRAPTPSAAAELLVPDRADLERLLAGSRVQLRRCMTRSIERRAQRLDQLSARLHAQHPQARLLRARDRLGLLQARLLRVAAHAQQRRADRLAHSLVRLRAADPQRRLRSATERGTAAHERLLAALARAIERRRHRLAELVRTLNAVSPLATLERGYAILDRPESGHLVRSVAQVQAGDGVRARLADGELALRVERIDRPAPAGSKRSEDPR